MIRDICHIKGKSENGPRHDPTQTEPERNGYENLLVMCVPHNRIVDGKKTRHLYPVEVLQEYKRRHEAQYQGTVVDEAAEDAFTDHFAVTGSVIITHNQSGGQNANTIINLSAQPPRPQVSLAPVVTSQLTKADDEVGLDYYDLRIALRNGGTKTVREFCVEVELPEKYMEGTGSFSSMVNPRTPGTKLLRHTQQSFGREFALYSGDAYPVFQLHFILKKQHYLLGITESVKVLVYSNDEPVSVTEHPMADMLNAERVEMVFGPRLTAIRKICRTAWKRIGGDGDPTSETLFLSDEPEPESLPPLTRSVYIRNAYNMGKALEKAGWLVFESEDAMSIRLTDAGVRAGS